MFRKLENSELLRISTEEFKEIKKIPVIVILDNVRSLNNVGSVFRTADAFLLQSIILCGITATPPNKEIHKTALGAEMSVDWAYYPETIDAVTQIRAEGFEIYSIEQAENSIPLDTFKFCEDKKYAFIFGNEVKGVQQEVVDISTGVIEIAQYGTKHSLNISITAGIVIWEAAKHFIYK